MKRRARSLSTIMAVLSSIFSTGTATASDVTFGVIGAQEYNLPVDYRPFNVVATYGEFNHGDKTYDRNGRLRDDPDVDLFVSLTKIVRFFKIDAVSDVGFAVEYVQPVVHVGAVGPDHTGFGDPLFGGLAWIKPTAKTTLGFQSLVSVPIGSGSIGSHSWSNLSSIFYDLQGKRFALSGDAGIIVRGDRHDRGDPRINQGSSYHVNLRPSVKTGTPIEPYLAFDWQSNGWSDIAGEASRIPGGHDTSIGVGALWALDKRQSFKAHYSRSVDGKNTARTNALYISFVKLF
jgi:hypothetical protein